MASYAAIHPNWEKPRDNMVDGYSLEMTAKEIDGLREAAPLIRPDTQIAVTFLPGEEIEQRIEAACLVRELGFEPIVHLSARRIKSFEELDILPRATSPRRARRKARLHHRRRPAGARRPVRGFACRSSRPACWKSTAIEIDRRRRPSGGPSERRRRTTCGCGWRRRSTRSAPTAWSR